MNYIKSSDKELFQGATPAVFQIGRKLRRETTFAEKILWNALRGKKINGLRFRRQHPLNKFVVDFYCHEKKLVIELDGEIHDSEEARLKDAERTVAIIELGIRLIRFKNEEVICELEKVIRKIRDLLIPRPHPGPSPKGEGGIEKVKHFKAKKQKALP